MQFDEQTKKQIQARMQELSEDPAFKEKLDREVSKLKGRNLKKYIREAAKKSEYEVRSPRI